MSVTAPANVEPSSSTGSLGSKIAGLVNNTCAKFEYAVLLTDPQVTEITNALKSNTSCTEVVLANVSIGNHGAKLFAQVLTSNSTIKKLDLGYNKIDGEGMLALGQAITNNQGLEELKIHRQASEMGPAIEEQLTKLWLTNITLQRMYATIHDRKYNGDNTRGEVRNKEIFRRKAAGKDFLDLDPARKDEYLAQQEAARQKAAADEAASNAPISEKIANTGGPYTYKQLTSAREFWPDDVEIGKRESYLSDEEFQTVFGMDKAALDKLPGWKKNGVKKEKKLN